MARLKPSERAGLPDRAFAYVDAKGRRRLPIHDAAHVRNALARFGQVDFEDEAAREHGPQPVAPGGQAVPDRADRLHHERAPVRRFHGGAAGRCHPGFVTLLMTDIEGSTALVDRLGDGYRPVLDDVCVIAARRGRRAMEVMRSRPAADEFFAVFATPAPPSTPRSPIAAGAARSGVARRVEVRVRIGIHSGYPTSTADNYIGLDVNTASRICAVGHGGQIVVSANTREAVKATAPDGVRFIALGEHRLRGLPDPVAAVPGRREGPGDPLPAAAHPCDRTSDAARRRR